MKTATAKKIVNESHNRGMFREALVKYVSPTRAEEIMSVLAPLFAVHERRNLGLVRADTLDCAATQTVLSTFLGTKVNCVLPFSLREPIARPAWMTKRTYEGVVSRIFRNGNLRGLYEACEVEDPSRGSISWAVKRKYPKKHGDAIIEDLVGGATSFIVKPYSVQMRVGSWAHKEWMASPIGEIQESICCFIDHVLLSGSYAKQPLAHFRPMAQLYSTMIPLGPRIGHPSTWVVLAA